MWTNGSRSASATPAKARRTGNPSPSNPDGAEVTLVTGRMVARVGSGTSMRSNTSRSSTVTAGMAHLRAPLTQWVDPQLNVEGPAAIPTRDEAIGVDRTSVV